MLDYSIIIVNFNGSKYFQTLFSSLETMDKKGNSYEIIVVDNASRDDSVFILKNIYATRFDQFNIICCTRNLGFAEGNNRGAQVAKGKFLIFLNNDTAVDRGWLHSIDVIARREDCLVTPKLVFFNEFIQIEDQLLGILNDTAIINGKTWSIDKRFLVNVEETNGRLLCTPQSQIRIPLLDGRNVPYVIEISINGHSKIYQYTIDTLQMKTFSIIQNAGSQINDSFAGEDIGFGRKDGIEFNYERTLNLACGASLCIRKDTFFRLGKFNKRFFMYYEDSDLSRTATEAGIPIIYCPDAVVRHFHMGSSSENPTVTFYIIRNRLLFLTRHYPIYVVIQEFGKDIQKSFRYILQIIIGRGSSRKRAHIAAVLSATAIAPFYFFSRYFRAQKSIKGIQL